MPTVHWQAVEVVRVVNPDFICGSIGEHRASKAKSCWYLCKKQNLNIQFPIVAFKFHKKTAHKGGKKTLKEYIRKIWVGVIHVHEGTEVPRMIPGLTG